MSAFRYFLSIIALLSSISIFPPTSAQEQASNRRNRPPSIQSAVEWVIPALVRFETIGGLERVGSQIANSGPTTGLLIDQQGHAVSAAINFAHQPSAIFARLADGKRVPASIIATDFSRKIVLLQLELPVGFVHPQLPIATPRKSLLVGQTVIAAGRVFDPIHPNLSTGIISATNRIWGKAIQTDAKISAANYGGPLLDLQGGVTGILVPLSPDDDSLFAGTEWYDSGIGFAVPLDEIISVVELLKQGTDLRAGLLGVSLEGTDIFADSAIVAYCSSDSPGWKSGIRAGDEIVEIDGQSIVRQTQLKHALGPRYENEKIKIVVRRANQRLRFSATLVGKLPPYQSIEIGILPALSATMGVETSDLTVGFVFADSGASQAGLSVGDQIVSAEEKPIHDWNELRKLIARMNKKQTLSLVVIRDGAEKMLPVAVEKMSASLRDQRSRLRTEQRNSTNSANWNSIPISVSDAENKSFAIVPTDQEDSPPSALLVWIPPPGQMETEPLVDLWKSDCAAENLIVLVPQSLESDRWQPDEAEFVTKAIAILRKQYSIDEHRISIGGSETGGAMAALIASQRRELFRGLILLNSYPSERTELISSPVEPLLLLIGESTKDKTNTARLNFQQRLEASKLPFWNVERPNSDLKNWVELLTIWAGSVDRL